MDKCIIIAEAGVNHNGSIELAKELISVAADSGADYVKFQTFNTDNMISKHANKAEYQKNKTAEERAHAERFGIFIGLLAPTFFLMAVLRNMM